MRIAMIGLGDIAQKAYLPLLACWKNIELVLCSRNEDVVRALASQYRIAEYVTDYRELIKKNIDAVTVHSSTESHFELASFFLENKIPVLIDKPIAYYLDEVKSLISLSKSKKVTFFTAFNRRYIPQYQPLYALESNYVCYKKNRFNLPGEIRNFVFDDFIHVLDSVLQVNKHIQDPSIHLLQKGNLLQAINVSWQHDSNIAIASMNRINACTEEEFECGSSVEKWRITNLEQVEHYDAEGKKNFLDNGWQSNLYKRGFVDMVAAFLGEIQVGDNLKLLESYLLTHSVAEEIVQYAQKKSS
ncbi:Gfo/Idh/MocA family oxidoreductase [Teredinibacter sp. KSP-S5-2]|uniref:Gfo/Idh/MocA family protein n=1 Tax=Teredinibacter sp. KSP-S5-2 TaxID=3034506 RepID=UPI0029346A0C|nr:Gfo/Idh/MocA family oxidoreductase [Teredinibacter sp. KSP-S5-2]WNO09261.1 Gfo/Idh/MocA family oxidoreductase [Teredinibacter sp. KSP-S5-2]